MKKHVADEKHSKALVDAEIVVETYFSWFHDGKAGFVADTDIAMDSLLGIIYIAPAPLPCELMEILNKQEPGYVARAFTAVTKKLVQCPFSITLKLVTANMLCDMLLWLKGQELLDQPEGTEGE